MLKLFRSIIEYPVGVVLLKGNNLSVEVVLLEGNKLHAEVV